MVIDDCNMFSAAIRPFKNDPPLAVDPYRVESTIIAFEQFQMVTRWDAKIINLSGTMNLAKFSQSTLLKI